MARNEASDTFVKHFLSALNEAGQIPESMTTFAARFDSPDIRSVFTRWDAAKRSIYFIPTIGFVNIHVRTEPPGFWGISTDVEKDFSFIRSSLNIVCMYVLLVGRRDKRGANGYILRSLDDPLLRSYSQSGKQLKINEKTDLKENALILGIDGVVPALIRQGANK